MGSDLLIRTIQRWRADRRTPRRGRLFVRGECGLCDAALVLLRPFQRSGRLDLELVDIDTDEALFRRYCFSIPVLELDDGAVLAWPFERADLRRVLR